MDATTARAVYEIKRQGYYREHQALGEGGWVAVNEFALHWKTYELRGASYNDLQEGFCQKRPDCHSGLSQTLQLKGIFLHDLGGVDLISCSTGEIK